MKMDQELKANVIGVWNKDTWKDTASQRKQEKPRAGNSDSCNALTHSEETDVDNMSEVAFSTIDMTTAWKAIQEDMIKQNKVNVPPIVKSEKSHNYYEPLMETDEEDDVWDLINMEELSPAT